MAFSIESREGWLLALELEAAPVLLPAAPVEL